MPRRPAPVLLVLSIGGLCSSACERPATQTVVVPAPPKTLPAVAAAELRAPAAFQVFSDRAERSRALFREAARVMLHPRCVNCHPSGDVPLQQEGSLHDPPVWRGPEDRGVVGMECMGCHQDRNLELSRVPGAPNWHLAPPSMAWQGRDAAALCEQLKDPARNGGKSVAMLIDHSEHDPLVAWGWAPGSGREPAPGSQPQFGALVAAWAEAGAECPPAGSAALSAGGGEH